MKNNGHNQSHNYAAEIAFHHQARTLPPSTRQTPSAASPGAPAKWTAWLRRARRRPPRTFWLLDPLTGRWRLL